MIGLAVLSAVALTACSGDDVEYVDVSIDVAYVSPDETKLLAIVNACDDRAKIDLDEGDTQVTLSASVPRIEERAPTDDCQTEVVVALDAPLGNRDVIDDDTQRELEVALAPANVDWEG